MNLPLPLLLFLTPIVGVLGMMLTSPKKEAQIRLIAAVAGAVSLVIALLLFFLYDRSVGGVQFITQIGSGETFGISLIFGVDGINIPMVILTTVVGFAGILSMWRLTNRVKEFYALFLVLLAGVIGAFISFDLFFFFLFYELAVLPMYLLIMVWGSKNKEYAAIKLTIYLLGASCLVITGFLMIYQTSGLDTFNFIELTQKVDFSPRFQNIVFLMLFFGFGTLAAVFPFHTWSPDGYAAAPTAASMVHAGVLKQLGVYGILRFAFGLCPEGAGTWSFLIGFLAVCNIVYGTIIAASQKDLKYMIGYSSVAHMGVVMLGLASVSTLGYTGAVFQMFAHGIVTALLFSCIGYIYETTGTRMINELGGLAKQFPLIAFAFVVAGLANVGMPGFAGFPAEVQIFLAVIRTYPLFAILGILGILFSTIYIFRALQKTLFGPVPEKFQQCGDATAVLAFPRMLLVVFLVIFGFCPQILVNLIRVTTETMRSFH